MFCAVSCADNANFEPENAQIEKREQLRENLSHEVTQAEARENLEKLLLEMKIPSTRGGGNADGYYLSHSFNPSNGAIYPDPIHPSNSTLNRNYQYEMEAIINIRK